MKARSLLFAIVLCASTAQAERLDYDPGTADENATFDYYARSYTECVYYKQLGMLQQGKRDAGEIVSYGVESCKYIFEQWLKARFPGAVPSQALKVREAAEATRVLRILVERGQ